MARSANLESGFQDRLIKKIEGVLPGCMVFKMNQRQGIPDLLVLYGKRWLSLECKKTRAAKHQPNQDWWVDRMNEASYSRFVYPENEKEVLDEIHRTFGPGG